MTPESPALSKHYILLNNIPLIYARVPKVANTSVKVALASLLDPKTIPDPDILTTDAAWKQGSHGKTRMVNAIDARRRRSSHFIFSFVRNPYDRLVSAYNNKLLENNHLSPAMLKMGLKRQMPFELFLEVVAVTPDQDLDIHLLPQSKILCLESQPIPNFIGKIEAIKDHWQLLQKRLNQAGLPNIGSLPHENVRRKHTADLSKYYTNHKCIALATSRYAEDIKIFYHKDDPKELASGNQRDTIHAPIERASCNSNPSWQ